MDIGESQRSDPAPVRGTPRIVGRTGQPVKLQDPFRDSAAADRGETVSCSGVGTGFRRDLRDSLLWRLRILGLGFEQGPMESSWISPGLTINDASIAIAIVLDFTG